MLARTRIQVRSSLSPGLVVMALVVSGLFVSSTAWPSQTRKPLDSANQNLFRVLAPLQSRDLTIFPVVRTGGNTRAREWKYLTLDEGLKSGQVVVTEAGQVMGLIRQRRPGFLSPGSTGDAVNRLVLVNNSSRPLVLLAGEIVTGGKQDRVIGKDGIVPPHSDPIDLSVFCIEPGRWTGESPDFRAAGKQGQSFMVEPEVREQAMAAQNQEKVWNAVDSAIHTMATVTGTAGALPTTSYARVMQDRAVQNQVDETARPFLGSGEALRATLHKEHAVGVVVAVRGEIIWADVFATTGMLERYWTKLIRSYAAEALTGRETGSGSPTIAAAEQFLAMASAGHTTSEGETGVYRYSTIRSGDVDSFVLRALLPGTGFEVHVSKIRTEPAARRVWLVR